MKLLEENVNHLLGGSSIKTPMLEEGINDKYLFKAVFLAGGPGSGKSFIAEKVYGGTGARLVNSDELLEFLFKKNDLSLIIAKEGTPEYEKQMKERAKAKSLVKVKQKNYVNGMLPIVVDGTGKDFDKIKKQALELKSHGYDVGMVFVNTSLEVAKERNMARARTVPEKVVVESWNAVQQNMGKFQGFFGKDFFIVDNSKKLNDAEIKKLNNDMAKIAFKLIKSKLQNPIGKSILERLRASGGKYMSDLLEESMVRSVETTLEEGITYYADTYIDDLEDYLREKYFKNQGINASVKTNASKAGDSEYKLIRKSDYDKHNNVEVSFAVNWNEDKSNLIIKGEVVYFGKDGKKKTKKFSFKFKKSMDDGEPFVTVNDLKKKLFPFLDKFLLEKIDESKVVSLLEESLVEIDSTETILEEAKSVKTFVHLIYKKLGDKDSFTATEKKMVKEFQKMHFAPTPKKISIIDGGGVKGDSSYEVVFRLLADSEVTVSPLRSQTSDYEIKYSKKGMLEEEINDVSKTSSVLEEQTNYFLD